MPPAFQLSTLKIALAITAIVFMVVYPIVLGTLLRRRLQVGWRYFVQGALVFFISQVVLRIPLFQAASLLLLPALQSSPVLGIGWGFVAALSAGIFEEVGRYLGYRTLMRREEKTWSKAVMFGAGHGGFESMFVSAAMALLQLLPYLTLTPEAFNALPPDARVELQAGAALPDWIALLGAWERLWIIAFHIGASVLVLQVFRRGSFRWLWLAILAHTLTDFLIPAVGPLLNLDLVSRYILTEALIALVGIAALWVTRALRDGPRTAQTVSV